MCDEKDSPVGKKICRHILQFQSGNGIKSGKRLIHDNDRFVFHQSADKGRALAHTPREFHREFCGISP